MTKAAKVFKRILQAGIITVYLAMIAILIWQALTPGSESANISQNVGDRLNDAIGEISTPEPLIVAVERVKISSVTVDGEKQTSDSIEMSLGDIGRINGEVYPKDATNKTLEYYSSDESVVEVYSDGRIFAASVGSATLTVRSEENPDYSYSVEVTVRKIPLESISFASDNIDISVGENSRLEVLIYPQNSTDKTLIWHSSDPGILSIDENGAVTAIAEGEVIISVTSESDPSIFASVNITVQPQKEAPEILLESIVLTAADSIGYIGDKMQVSAELYPAGATGRILWYSSDESVATVTQNGVVKFLASGDVTITAKCGSVSEIIKFSVKEVISDEFNFSFEGVEYSDESGYQIKQGSTGRIIVDLGESATVRDIVFSSSDESVAQVSPDGYIEALKGGTTTITVSTSYEGTTISHSIKINISPLTFADTVDNFYYWVRKSMGHFGAFLILGIFAALSYYIIFKKNLLGKFLAFVVCLVAGFAVASITEILQLPYFTAGRYCSFDDVILDFVGYCTSTIPIFVLILIGHLLISAVKAIKGRK